MDGIVQNIPSEDCENIVDLPETITHILLNKNNESVRERLDAIFDYFLSEDWDNIVVLPEETTTPMIVSKNNEPGRECQNAIDHSILHEDYENIVVLPETTTSTLGNKNKEHVRECQNCRRTDAKTWRRGDEYELFCSACFLFENRTGEKRSMVLATRPTQQRKRFKRDAITAPVGVTEELKTQVPGKPGVE